MAHDAEAFRALQARLRPLWPALTPRAFHEERTLVVVSSISLPAPAHLAPVWPAYEERYLFYVLALAKGRNTRVVYVTSQPMLPRLVDYYFDLVPAEVRADLRRRLTIVSVGDGSNRPLTTKILERPLLVERLRSLVPDPTRGLLLPFVTTGLEAELAIRLGIPVYGPDPDLSWLGTQQGSRRAFAAAGVPHARGADVRDVDDVVDALVDLQRERPSRRAVVKLDEGISGLGNAIVDLDLAVERDAIARRVASLAPEDTELGADAFLAALASGGGVVEEWLEGGSVQSPSVQLRASPEAEVEILSTHDQILGGPTGQSYLGCRFPAHPDYAASITEQARSIGCELARRGVIGRFAVDFVTVRDADGGWDPYAVEINLRNGGTTHPSITLAALCDGSYDEDACELRSGGVAKHYVATDHLERPEYACLTPDDVLDLVEPEGLGWDCERETGIAFHLLSAVAVAGRVGLTAIGNSPAEADALYERAAAALDRAAGVTERVASPA